VTPGPTDPRAGAAGWLPWRSLRFTLVATVALAGVAWLLTRHTDHVVRYLPLLILLGCPLMHVFGHGHGHGHGRGQGHHGSHGDGPGKA
jgi:hypothetical protein